VANAPQVAPRAVAAAAVGVVVAAVLLAAAGYAGGRLSRDLGRAGS
jgi:hypothetical protein